MKKKTVRDLSDAQVRGKRALVRVDFNVPLDDDGNITDDTRIRASLPTLELLLERGARSCFFRTSDGRRGSRTRSIRCSRSPNVSRSFAERTVIFVETTDTDEAMQARTTSKPERSSFSRTRASSAARRTNDQRLSRALAELGDFFVNDAFGAAHRAHASTVGVAQHLQPAVAGLLMEKELDYLGGALDEPEASVRRDTRRREDLREDRRHRAAAAQGRWASDRRRDGVHVLSGDGTRDGKVARRRGSRRRWRRICSTTAGTRLILRTMRWSRRRSIARRQAKAVSRNAIPADRRCSTSARESAASYARAIAAAKTIIWNGPMGVFETPPFDAGTRAIAEAMASATAKGATTIVGGGDSAAAVAAGGLETRR